jgi:hypothetical protein
MAVYRTVFEEHLPHPRVGRDGLTDAERGYCLYQPGSSSTTPVNKVYSSGARPVDALLYSDPLHPLAGKVVQTVNIESPLAPPPKALTERPYPVTPEYLADLLENVKDLLERAEERADRAVWLGAALGVPVNLLSGLIARLLRLPPN